MVVILSIVYIIIIFSTGRQAANRGMSQWGGILLGILLGPLGLAIVLLMPDRRNG
jgi:hypothetical protein